MKKPEVVVTTPIVDEIIDFEDFTGHTESPSAVTVRARVSGYLDTILFREGDMVEAGKPLFEIDPRIYLAALHRTEANVKQAEAHLTRLKRDFHRAEDLLRTNALAQEDFDRIAGDRDEAAAAVDLAKAQRDEAALNVAFTKVTALVSGRISRKLVDPGNLVKADETPLTTIVSTDKLHAYFDIDDRTMFRVRRLIRAGKMKSAMEAKAPVYLGLADEEDQFPHEGVIDFVDNQVDAPTGTLRLRGAFDNPTALIPPGVFVRIRVPIGQKHKALLLKEQALATDQGEKFVYVVNDKQEVVYRRVKMGALHNGCRVIEEGLAEGERVIVSGVQRVKPGVKVDAREDDAAKKLPVVAAAPAVEAKPAVDSKPAEAKPAVVIPASAAK